MVSNVKRVINLKNTLNYRLSKSNDDEENELTIKIEHVEKFFETLHTTMLKLGNLQLGLCLLHKLSLPFLTISGNRVR